MRESPSSLPSTARDRRVRKGRSAGRRASAFRDAPTSQLRVELFGGMRVSLAFHRAEEKITRSVRALLAYLLLQRRRRHPRDVLAGVFWGDHTDARARSCLSTTLWRLRQVLEPRGTPHGTYIIATPNGDIGFNGDSVHWLDAAIFEDSVTPIVSRPTSAIVPSDAAVLQDAMALYVGDLLEGFYDEWAIRERERLKQLHLAGLTHLLHYHRARDAYDDAVACAQAILRCDPLREEVHREIIRLHLTHGQRALAMRQYDTCRAVLDAELEIHPAAETRQLLMEGPVAATPSAAAGAEGQVQLLDVLRTLEQAMQELGTLRERVRRAIAVVEHRTSGETTRSGDVRSREGGAASQSHRRFGGESGVTPA